MENRYREGIQELYEIRIDLMRRKATTLSESDIHELAGEQWARTEAAHQYLADELYGICEGSNLTRQQTVVLNNYTDFRDIELPEEGCSSVYARSPAGPIAGQTWDMHGSAKHYVCCIRLPGPIETVVFSIVGCVGMMGYTSIGTMVGVNNINTTGAVPGALWPVTVRETLQKPDLAAMADYLSTADVTSGHSYLLAAEDGAEMWEVMPGLSERVSWLHEDYGSLFHTNHCLGEHTLLRELPTSQNSTTHIRYELIEKKIGNVQSLDDVCGLLNDHENYPRAICSNFQTNAQDPSITCGGAVGDLTTGQVVMWRGDELYDDNFRQHTFQLRRLPTSAVDESG